MHIESSPRACMHSPALCHTVISIRAEGCARGHALSCKLPLRTGASASLHCERICGRVLCQGRLASSLHTCARVPVVAVGAAPTVRLAVWALCSAMSTEVVEAVHVLARSTGDDIASATHLHSEATAGAAHLASDVVLVRELGARGTAHNARSGQEQ